MYGRDDRCRTRSELVARRGGCRDARQRAEGVIEMACRSGGCCCERTGRSRRRAVAERGGDNEKERRCGQIMQAARAEVSAQEG